MMFNISYCHYNQWEKLENDYKISFWKSQYFFKKRECTHMLAPTPPPLPLLDFVRFSMTPFPPLLNERTFWMTPWLCLLLSLCYHVPLYILLSSRTSTRLPFKSMKLKNLPKDILEKCWNSFSDADGTLEW